MCEQILFPSGFNRRFERQDQDSLQPHSLGKLIGGKGLAETHLAVPKELRCLVRLFFFGFLEVFFRVLDGSDLLRTHLESCGSPSCRDDSVSHFQNGFLDII